MRLLFSARGLDNQALMISKCWTRCSCFALLYAALLVSGCDDKDATADAVKDQAASVTPASGKELYAARCATCHGTSGKGDGPAGIHLQPKPADFTSAAWQASVTDAHLEAIISRGGAAVGRSPVMPGAPDLAGQPESIKALVQQVRGFKP